MEFYNPNVARYLLNVPIEDLMEELRDSLEEKGNSKIERKDLGRFLIEAVPYMRLELPRDETIKYAEIGSEEADKIIQELLSQHFLILSEDNPNPKTELYFKMELNSTRFK